MLEENEFNMNFIKKRREEGVQKFLAVIAWIWHLLSPLNSDIETVRKEYDTLIVNYFTFFRF